LKADKRARLGLFLAFQYPTAIPGLSVASFLRTAMNARRSGLERDPEFDPSDPVKGGVFGKLAIVLVQGYEPRAETQRRPDIGGDSDVMYMYDEYAYGERSAGNWLYSIYTDVTSPSS